MMKAQYGNIVLPKSKYLCIYLVQIKQYYPQLIQFVNSRNVSFNHYIAVEVPVSMGIDLGVEKSTRHLLEAKS